MDQNHSFAYANNEINIGGVTKVESFEPKEITLRLQGGVMDIKGNDFVLKDMTVSTGKISFSGKISSVEYKDKAEPTSFFKKLFK